MLRHVVLFRWTEGASTQQKEAAVAALERFGSRIAPLGRLTAGADVGLAESNADAAVVADFDSAEDYKAYAANPDHQQVIAEYVKPIVKERQAVQYKL